MGQKYRILSFNIRDFGNDKTNYDEIVKIINNSGQPFDIVAIQEISSADPLKTLMNKLGIVNKEIKNPSPVDCGSSRGFESNNWGARWAKPNSKYKSIIAEEGYAFIWNKRSVILPVSNKGKEFEPRIFNQYKAGESGRKLLRQPFYGRFSMRNCYGEIRVINTHIIWSKVANDKSDEKDNVIIRNEEHRILCEAIYPKIDDKTFDYALHDFDYELRPVYTFIVGDYNLNLKSSKTKGSFFDKEEIDLADGNRRKRIVTRQMDLTTIRNKINSDMLPDEEKWLASNYDHASFDEIRFTKIGVHPDVERLDVVDYRDDDKRKEYLEGVSDHLPIVVTLDIDNRKLIVRRLLWTIKNSYRLLMH